MTHFEKQDILFILQTSLVCDPISEALSRPRDFSPYNAYNSPYYDELKWTLKNARRGSHLVPTLSATIRTRICKFQPKYLPSLENTSTFVPLSGLAQSVLVNCEQKIDKNSSDQILCRRFYHLLVQLF